ncbi:MAG: phosphoserine phosphatase [Chlorobi bacterium]|nr:phosphoserine phosphatase [Chlorobiota bacterium]
MISEASQQSDNPLYTVRIFCDFDGTISGKDIGFDFFNRFSVQEPWNGMMLNHEISVTDYWRRMASGLRDPLTTEFLDDYLRSIPVDPGLDDLLTLIRERSVPFTVVSDGFDLYIRRFLAIHGVHHLDIYANHAGLTADGRMEVSFPHAAEGCACFCATCKRNLVLSLSSPDDRIVYIGDGVSDYCPAEHADVIFAKGSLAAYCNAHRLPHYPFKTLADVALQLRTLLERRRLRPRHQAALKRKGVWEGE